MLNSLPQHVLALSRCSETRFMKSSPNETNFTVWQRLLKEHVGMAEALTNTVNKLMHEIWIRRVLIFFIQRMTKHDCINPINRYMSTIWI